MKQNTLPPPKLANRALRLFCKPQYLEDIQGDLEEEFSEKSFRSGIKAHFWYYWQVIRLLRPTLVKKIKPQDTIEKESIMFRNYLKIGLRNLWKYKSSTLINIIGLATGMAAFVLIALFVSDEYSYDLHHKHAADIYRVTVKNYTAEGTVSRHWAFGSAGHAERLKTDYPQITHAVRFYPWAFPDLTYGEQKFRGEPVIFTDAEVFDVFSFSFIIGNAENALKDLHSLVLTETTAIKIFGNDWQEKDILGEPVNLSRDENSTTFKVTGVIRDMPDQQHFHFDYLAPIRFVEMILGEQAISNVGGNYNWMTYIRTAPNTDISSLEKQANETFWDKYMGTFPSGAKARDYYDFHFQALKKIHLTSNLEGEYETNGSQEQVYIFSVVGILLLLVACVNYMNIATSHYSRRMKEVGIRKVIGAYRSALIKQFLTESTLVTIFSLPLCILLIYQALPHLNAFMDKSLTFNPITNFDIFGILICLIAGVGLFAGLYPATFLSRINLVNALKGEQTANVSKWNFRSFLVTFQYTVTIALIFAIAVIESQMTFIQRTDPGYQRDQVLSLSLPRNLNNETFKNQLLAHPRIETASYSSRIPTGRLADSWGARFFAGDSAISTSFRLPVVSVDPDFLKTYEIDLLAGENFREGMETRLGEDSIPPAHYIINHAAAKAFGYEKPEEIVGMKLGYGNTEGRVIGVMDDFHFESMHSPIVPMLMLYVDHYLRISLKIREGELRNTLDYIEKTYASFDPEGSANYRFVDELFNEQYQQEERLSIMIKVFAVIAILIGCLGLVGMVGFIIETRLKEIGVRKVLGASTASIWMLISNRFLVLIAIAFLLAIPVAYWLMSGWLDNFVYRTSISIWIILLPVLAAAVLTLLAISYQTIKASLINPVECLKDE